MTVTVARHLVPQPDGHAFADKLSVRVNRRVDGLEGSAGMIDFAFSTALLAESPYIPTYLVSRGWLGEFPT
ncbi:hypothetical protein AB0C76_35440 [Kitasatospora sp. NPDC048722]|uniref:hypothetical protein n=1 Tax=Kitasatospora sp. NPDC048722 TaxID=3155639 RepID=UPI003405EA3A